jgi:hypothetical protein
VVSDSVFWGRYLLLETFHTSSKEFCEVQLEDAKLGILWNIGKVRKDSGLLFAAILGIAGFLFIVQV